MRFRFLLVVAATLVFAQPYAGLGVFENQTDVGNPDLKGSAAYDAATKEYKLSGSGVNMWAKSDQFHFLWKKLSGNVRLTATLHFVGTSPTAHRKAGLMLRKTLDAGSPYVDAVVHGVGLTELQDRETPDDITRGFAFPVEGPQRIALEKRGNVYSMWYGNPGEPLKEGGWIQVNLGNDLYAGLFICSHDPKLMESAVFSDVTIEPLPATPRPAGKKGGRKK